MADIKTLVEEAKTAARKHAPNARAIIVAIDTLAEAHQAEVSRLTREAENVRRKWLGHRDTGHLSLVEAADHVVGCLHADIDRLTRENEGLAKDAARYRCLRHSLSGQARCSHTRMPLITDPANSMLTYLPHGLDDCLDSIIAARAALAGASGAQEGERT